MSKTRWNANSRPALRTGVFEENSRTRNNLTNNRLLALLVLNRRKFGCAELTVLLPNGDV